jgi:hypothetical protein
MSGGPWGERGQRLLAGGTFQSEYPEAPNTATSALEEEKVLNKIIADYNQSGNPGKFRVVKEPEGRFAVIGQYVKDDAGRDEYVSPILDTPISIPTETRGALETVYLIVEQLSAKTGIKIGYLDWGNSILRSRLTLGGQNIPARSLLMQTLASSNRPGQQGSFPQDSPERPWHALSDPYDGPQLGLYLRTDKARTPSLASAQCEI